jgi:hypothetical protein
MSFWNPCSPTEAALKLRFDPISKAVPFDILTLFLTIFESLAEKVATRSKTAVNRLDRWRLKLDSATCATSMLLSGSRVSDTFPLTPYQ